MSNFHSCSSCIDASQFADISQLNQLWCSPECLIWCVRLFWLNRYKLKGFMLSARICYGHNSIMHASVDLTTDYYKDAQRRWKQTEKSDLLCEHVRKRKEHWKFRLDSPANHLESNRKGNAPFFSVSMPTVNLPIRLTHCNWHFGNIFRTCTLARSMKL